MIPLGYLPKHIAAPPDWFHAPQIKAIHAVAGCVSRNAVDVDPQWRHNGWWFFDTPALAMQVATEAGADPATVTLLYCEAHEREYDGEHATWSDCTPAAAAVEPPQEAAPSGYDVVCFMDKSGPPGCSPLSCNGLAAGTAVNEFGLFPTLDAARAALEGGHFHHAEPGPYRILSVAVVPKP